MSATYVTTPARRGGQYWDPANEFEPAETIYTLTVYVPPRPSKWYRPYRPQIHRQFFIRSDSIKPGDAIRSHSLKYLDRETVKIKSRLFPLEVRCKHLAEKTECKKGCYILEEGDKGKTRRQCKRNDCLGHVYCDPVKSLVYCDPVKETEKMVECFGKKSQRLVALKSNG